MTTDKERHAEAIEIIGEPLAKGHYSTSHYRFRVYFHFRNRRLAGIRLRRLRSRRPRQGCQPNRDPANLRAFPQFRYPGRAVCGGSEDCPEAVWRFSSLSENRFPAGRENVPRDPVRMCQRLRRSAKRDPVVGRRSQGKALSLPNFPAFPVPVLGRQANLKIERRPYIAARRAYHQRGREGHSRRYG